MIPEPGTANPDNHVKASRNIAGSSGMTKLVGRVAVDRVKIYMDRVLELVGEGCLINGATLSHFVSKMLKLLPV